jgi:hypothetical protein
MGIDNISRDEAKALLKELEKIGDIEFGEPIDTTIFDSIKRRNEIEQQLDAEDKLEKKNDGNN